MNYINSKLLQRSAHTARCSFFSTIVKSKFTLNQAAKTLLTLPLPQVIMSQFMDEKRKDKVALLDGSSDSALTYSDCVCASNSFADSLSRLGIRKGDNVAIVSPNHIHYFTCVMGVLLIGARISPLNPLYAKSELQFPFSLLDVKAIIFHPNCLDAVLEVVPKGIVAIMIDTEYNAAAVGPEIHRLSTLISTTNAATTVNIPKYKDFNPRDLACIPFSSGTTGQSKGVSLTHQNIVANLLQMEAIEGSALTAQELPVICPLPFFHIYGLVIGLFLSMYSGKKLIFLPAPFEFKQFLQLIEDHRVDRGYVVPPLVLSLAKQPLVEQFDLTSLRCLVSAAAPLGAEVQRACAERLKCLVKQAWGMSELSPVATYIPDSFANDEKQFGSVGLLVPLTEAKIVDPLSGQDLSQDQEGELWIRGPQVMAGYYDNEAATKATITEDGWLKTGDIARWDADADWLFITDRLKELIKYKGFQVAPAELEALLQSHEHLQDAIVIPVADDAAGELPRAYVVKKATAPNHLSTEDIQAFVNERVAPHKRLRGGVFFIDQVPKNASGKLLRREMRVIDKDLQKNDRK